MFSFRKYFEAMLLFCFVLILAGGCKKDDSPTESTPTTFVGTWKLTMLSATISGQPVSLTPEMAGTQITIVSKQDGTFTMTTTDATGSITNNGNWSISGTNLILKYTDNTSATLPFTLVNNSLTIKDYPYTHPLYGSLLITLVFAKQ